MKRIACLLALSVLLLGLCGCQNATLPAAPHSPSVQNTVQPLVREGFALDTPCTITLYDAQSESLLDSVMTLLSDREALWSRTAEGSDITVLNNAAGASIAVNADTTSLLQTAVFYTAMTEGAFDITTATVSDLWAAAEQSGTPPSAEALAAALATVGADKVSIGANGTVTLSGGAKLDLGGIAKGQIADEAAQLLKDNGCTSGIIALGGNVVVIGSKPDGSDFHVGIANPADDTKLIATVAVSDCSVVTSGSYARGYQVGETRYSHILDPKTGNPVQNDLASVTILSPMSVDGDALSTACFVMGYEKATALLSQFQDIEAVFVKTDGTVLTTGGVTLV